MASLVRRKFYRQSLKIKDKSEAIKKAIALNTKGEAAWSALLKAAGVTQDSQDTRTTVNDANALLPVHGLQPGDGSKDFGGITGHDLVENLVLGPACGTAWNAARHAGYDEPHISSEERSALIDEAGSKLLNPAHKQALDLLHSTEPLPVFITAARDLFICASKNRLKAVVSCSSGIR